MQRGVTEITTLSRSIQILPKTLQKYQFNAFMHGPPPPTIGLLTRTQTLLKKKTPKQTKTVTECEV